MNNVKDIFKQKECWKNKKTIFITVLIFLAFCFCVVGNIYKTDVLVNTNFYYSDAGTVSVNIMSGDVIEQEFVLQEGDEGVAVLFATYMTEVTAGIIDASICDETGNMVASFFIPATTIMDNQFCNFEFEDVASDLVNQKCTLRLEFKDIDGQMVALYNSDSDTTGCSYRINGVEQANDMVMTGIQKNADWHLRDFRLFYVFAFVLFIAYMMYKFTLKNIEEKVHQFVLYVIDNKKNIIIILLTTVASVGLAFIGEFLWAKSSGGWNPYRVLMLYVVFMIIGITIVFRKNLWKYAHVYFFMLVMLVGIFMIVTVPPANLSWDEQIHYMRTAYLSWGANGSVSEPDYLLYVKSTSYLESMVAQRENRAALINEFNNLSYSSTVNAGEAVGIFSVAYTPAAIALYVGRKLKLDFCCVYMLGKLVNLTCYASFIALAIKKIQGRGKILVAAIGLIPTSIFLAVTYSYDWWLISLLILGFSIFIGEIQKHGSISTLKLCQSIIVIVIGMLPKAVYFPLLFPLMVLKKDYYEDSKKARIIVGLGMVFLMASFMLPLLVSSGTGLEDFRGGSDVNSAEQIKFILSNLVGYAKILFDFFWSYFSPDQAYQYLTFWAYLGTVEYTPLCMIVLAIATVIDNSENTAFRNKIPWIRVANFLGVFASMVLVATALYVAFTPVGYETVNGCQLRYFLPTLFPLLFFMGENKIQLDVALKKKAFVFVSLTMVYITINGWYNAIVVTY